MTAAPDGPAWGTRPAPPAPPRAILHPALAGETERLVAEHRAVLWELKVRQGSFRIAAIAFGAWMVLDGVLFVASGPQRLTSPVFAYASEVIPAWPVPFAAWISLAGLGLVYAAVAASIRAGALSLLAISAWQFVYCLLVWHAIAVPPPPPARLVSYPPVADHGALSAVACIWGLMLWKIWRRTGLAHLDHAS